MIMCIDAGVVSYKEALKWQKSLAKKRQKDEIADHLLLLEHPPVYTMGRRDSSQDMMMSEQWLRENGMEILKTDRGGRVTYHGPGQLVGYLIFRIKDSIPKLVWKMEEALLGVLKQFYIPGDRDKDYPGIWVEKSKIAALGLHIERGVSTHGFALNVSCDLRPFEFIHPCGIKDRTVTSVEKEIGWHPSMRDVKHLLLKEFSRVFEDNISLDGTLPTFTE